MSFEIIPWESRVQETNAFHVVGKKNRFQSVSINNEWIFLVKNQQFVQKGGSTSSPDRRREAWSSTEQVERVGIEPVVIYI